MRELFNRFVFIKELHKIIPQENQYRFFKVVIERMGEGEYITWTNWGRIGTLGQDEQRKYGGKDLKDAFNVAFGKINEKLKEGYRELYELESDVNISKTKNSQKNKSGIQPQVFNLFTDEKDITEICNTVNRAPRTIENHFILWLTAEIYESHQEYINSMLPDKAKCLEIKCSLLENDGLRPVFEKYNDQYSFFQLQLIRELYINKMILCFGCGKRLTERNIEYCKNQAERFNNHIYCYDCQRITIN